jgi:hypothetical protein
MEAWARNEESPQLTLESSVADCELLGRPGHNNQGETPLSHPVEDLPPLKWAHRRWEESARSWHMVP